MHNAGKGRLNQYKRTGNMDDLQTAISKSELAVCTTSEDHPGRAEMLNILTDMLSKRFDQTGNTKDLQAAISNAELAVSATSEDHPNRAAQLNNLAIMISYRWNRTNNMDDLCYTPFVEIYHSWLKWPQPWIFVPSTDECVISSCHFDPSHRG